MGTTPRAEWPAGFFVAPTSSGGSCDGGYDDESATATNVRGSHATAIDVCNVGDRVGHLSGRSRRERLGRPDQVRRAAGRRLRRRRRRVERTEPPKARSLGANVGGAGRRLAGGRELAAVRD